jgi:hypothetical protein
VALCGGAFAATASKTKKSGGVIITKLSQISPSVRNQLKGATGPQGAKGDTGAQGAQGSKGDPGAKGNDGAPGKSVVVNEIPPETFGCNELGGVEVGVEGQAAIELCNGKDGNPWTAGGTLPAGATETGTYGMQTSDESGEFGIWAPISFQIPLATDTQTAASANVEYGPAKETAVPSPEEEEFFEVCPGSYDSPQALPGHLCIFENEAIAKYNTTFVGVKAGPTAGLSGVLSSGAYLEFAPNEAAELAVVAGSFAITGCDASLPSGTSNKCP